jgi:acetate kinase
MRVLVINSGSSSVKYQLIESGTGERLTSGLVEEVDDHRAALRHVVEEVASLGDAGVVEAIGHRLVHGGEVFAEPTLITGEVIGVLHELIALAPLHNPANLAGVEAARTAWPDVPQVAVFDTAFHRSLPPHAYRYAVPQDWYTDHGVRRYGFHGTSHDFVSSKAADVLGRPRTELDLIVAHLGNGASMSAIAKGRCVDTSMGLTPLEGLVMGTRSGDIDPAVIGHVADATGRPEAAVIDDLNRSSGLLGLGGASDMRNIELRASTGDDAAALPFEVFCYRISKYVGAYIAVLGRCDALVFTAGIGEHSASVRARVCDRLAVFGVELDSGRNERSGRTISTDASAMAVLVVPTDEEHAIAEHTAAVIEHAV